MTLIFDMSIYWIFWPIRMSLTFFYDFVNRNILDATVHTADSGTCDILMYSVKTRLTRHIICSCSVWRLFTLGFWTSNCMSIIPAQSWNSECLEILGKRVKVFSLFIIIFSAYKIRISDKWSRLITTLI